MNFSLKSFSKFVTERKLIEDVHGNPGSTIIGMGPVKFPGNAGTTTQFAGQSLGSGDGAPMFVLDTKSKNDEEEEKKRLKRIKDKLNGKSK